ncbi:MAG: amino acid permease [Planctomycetes bacterium]|nr:amino acid permease [Planctomycetota bacterium]
MIGVHGRTRGAADLRKAPAISIPPDADRPAGPVRHLGVLDAMAVVIGIVVGVGIFKSPSLVAGCTGTPWLMFTAWGLGGLLCLCGALTYAELASAYPKVGGEYVFLSRAFGRGVGFLFVWARLTVIQTGTIAATAYVFGDYMQRLQSLGTYGPLMWALGATVVLTACNVVGLKAGRWTQNLLTLVKMAGVAAVALAGLVAAPHVAAEGAAAAEPASDAGPSLAGFGLAMIFVLYTFGGWNEAAYVAGELKHKRRSMLWVLLGSILLLSALYAVVNLAYLRVLGMEGMAGSKAVAADAMLAFGGRWAERAVTVLVAVSALGAMNGCIFTGARAICGLGEDFRPLRWLGQWHPRLGTPTTAIVVQSAIAVVLVVLPSLGEGFRDALGSGFEAAVEYTSPVFWLFFLATGVSAFVLRVREPEVRRPFRVPLFPITVLAFCLMCGYMLYSSVMYTRMGALVGVAVLAVGVPVYFLFRERPEKPREE